MEILKKINEAEKTLGLKIQLTTCDNTEKRRSAVLASFQNFAPGSKHQRKMNLSFLVHRSS